MQFQNFPWSLVQFIEKHQCDRLKNPTGSGFDVLLHDAIEIGLDPVRQHVLGFAGRIVRGRRQRDMAMVGLDLSKTKAADIAGNYNGYQYGYEDATARKRYFILPYHIVIRVGGNPLELHWRWTPNEGTKLAVLNLEIGTSGSQVNEMWREMDSVTIKLRPRGGGPKATSDAKKKEIVLEWRSQKGKKFKWQVASEKGVNERTIDKWEADLVAREIIPPGA